MISHDERVREEHWFPSLRSSAPRFGPRAAARFTVALVLGGAALVLGLTLPTHWNLHLPLVTFYTVLIVASAWYGGFWPGLLSTLLCVGGVAYWLEPGGSFRVRHGSDVAGLLLFLTIGVVVSGLNERLLRARNREQAAREEAEKAAETERTARRAREEILAIVAHDLRNPLNTIQMSTLLIEQAAAGGAAGAAEVRKRVGTVQRNVVKMNRIVADLLDMGALEAGKLSIEASPQAVGSLFQETIEIHGCDAGAKSIKLESQIPWDAPPVLCDRERILQVLSSLTGNALKFTPRGGHVELCALVLDGSMQIQVRDTGPGCCARLPVSRLRAQLARTPRGRRRERPRALHRQGHRGGARRHALGRERRGPGEHLLLHAARRERLKERRTKARRRTRVFLRMPTPCRAVVLLPLLAACAGSPAPSAQARGGQTFPDAVRMICDVDRAAGLSDDSDPLALGRLRSEWLSANIDNPDGIYLKTMLSVKAAGEQATELREQARNLGASGCALADSIDRTSTGGLSP